MAPGLSHHRNHRQGDQTETPQTNGKVECFHRTLLEEWDYIRPRTSEPERHTGYDAFTHFYNHHRAHGALNWATPAATLDNLQDNAPEDHN